jgi:pre-mRNA-splicing factor ATP-dependent RNA helicase DHX15/PRP43
MSNMTEPPSKRSKTGGLDAGDAGPSSNPYLAHLAPQKGAGTGSNGNGVGAGTGKNPLNGLVPRMVTTEQAKKILVSSFHLQCG